MTQQQPPNCYRTRPADDELAGIMLGEVAIKQRGHGIDDPAFEQPERPMSAIGG